MSFHTTIARLREAAAARVKGEAPETCRVQREDLRVALHVIDRLGSDLRQAGVLTQGTVAADRQQRGEEANLKPITRYSIFGHLIGPDPQGLYVRYEDHRAALSAQPGAQRTGGSDA